MRAAGYHTMMAGKWHLGLTPDQDPHARGFDRSFALLQGAHNHFGKGGFGPDDHPNTAAWYSQNGVRVGVPDDFYSSDYFTTKLIGQLDEAPKTRSEEHTSELQSLMRISYAVLCLKTTTNLTNHYTHIQQR